MHWAAAGQVAKSAAAIADSLPDAALAVLPPAPPASSLPAAVPIARSSSASAGSTRGGRRMLTKPAQGVRNDGYDNENSDFIMAAGDVLINSEGSKYVVLDMLGQGTFGQVRL
jgi:hypothetical protein